MRKLRAWGTLLAGVVYVAAGGAVAEVHLWAKIGATDAGETADLGARLSPRRSFSTFR